MTTVYASLFLFPNLILTLVLANLTGDDLSESFLVIPSGSEPVELKKENVALKAELVNMQKQLEMAEKMLHIREKQDQQLRNSIYLAGREVRLTAFPMPAMN